MDIQIFPQTNSVSGEVKSRFGYFSAITSFVSQPLSTQGLVVVKGYGELGEESAAKAIELSILGYEVFERRRFYHEAREHLLMQLFRSVSRSLFKYGGKYSASLTVLLFSERFWWLATTGEERVFLLRQNDFRKLYPSETAFIATPGIRMGGQKFVEPALSLQGEIKNGDVFIVTTGDVMLTVNERKLLDLLTTGKQTQLSYEDTAKSIVAEAQERRKEGEYGVALVEK